MSSRPTLSTTVREFPTAADSVFDPRVGRHARRGLHLVETLVTSVGGDISLADTARKPTRPSANDFPESPLSSSNSEAFICPHDRRFLTVGGTVRRMFPRFVHRVRPSSSRWRGCSWGWPISMWSLSGPCYIPRRCRRPHRWFAVLIVGRDGDGRPPDRRDILLVGLRSPSAASSVSSTSARFPFLTTHYWGGWLFAGVGLYYTGTHVPAGQRATRSAKC